MSDQLQWIYSQAGNFTITLKAQDDDMAATDWSTDQVAILVKSVASIEVIDSIAKEVDSTDTAQIKVKLKGTTTADTVVNLNYSGEATKGADYQLSAPGVASVGTSITIPAGTDPSVTLTLTAIDDATIENLDDAVITLAPGAGYKIGTDSTGTVTVRDHARVETIHAVGGDIKPTSLNLSNSLYQLIQGDTAQFRAIPSAGGDFPSGSPTWTVSGITGPPGPPGDLFSVTFTQFAPNRIIAADSGVGGAAGLVLKPAKAGVMFSRV